MKVLLLFNPKAERGRAARLLGNIRARFERCGIALTVAITRHPGHGESLVAQSSLTAFDAVAAAGGDGTLFETLNGLMSHAPMQRPPLAVIPLGTGNAFSRDVGLGPGQWRKGIDLLARGSRRWIDVGLLECGGDRFHFLNIAGFGFVTAAGRTAARLKFLGRTAYTLGALWHCLRLDCRSVSMEVDGQVVNEECAFVEISNSRYTGNSFLIAPQARIADGQFDLVMLGCLSRLRLLRLFPTIYSGRHVELEEVTTMRGEEFTFHSPSGSAFMVDGEFRGTTPARIRCLRGAIEVFAKNGAGR